MDEFSLINQYFTHCGESQDNVLLGIGDDAAIVQAKPNARLVMTMDTLIESVHFPKSTSAAAIAHKALAVNLSDLAAMGAEPAWFLLSISLPDVNTDWLQKFSLSLSQQARKYGVQLIGGDTCKGGLSITIQATGFVVDKAVLRSGAQLGEQIFVSGSLGNAALGLAMSQNKISKNDDFSLYEQALNKPTPRFDVSNIVRQFATSMIDISDGLLADLGHILKASDCGAALFLDKIPMPGFIRDRDKHHYALSGGDDYELCFTVPDGFVDEMMVVLKKQNIEVFHIGAITDSGVEQLGITQSRIALYKDRGMEKINLSTIKGFQHFG